jgi:hypothetical protein
MRCVLATCLLAACVANGGQKLASARARNSIVADGWTLLLDAAGSPEREALPSTDSPPGSMVAGYGS